MKRSLRWLAGLLLAGTAPSTLALTQIVKREVPANIPGVYQKGMPIEIPGSMLEDPAFDGLRMWVPDRGNNLIYRYDIASNKPAGDPIAVNGPRRILFDGVSLWVLVLDEARVYKFSTTGKPQGSVALSGSSDMGAFDGDSIWVPTYTSEGDALDRIDVASGTVTTFRDPALRAGIPGFDGKHLWISAQEGLFRYDVSSGTPVAAGGIPGLPAATGTSGLTFDGEYLWVNSDQETAKVYKVNVATSELIATLDLYPGVHGSAFDGRLLWVLCFESIVKIDVRTNQVVGVVDLPAGSYAHDVAFDGMFMWVTTEAGRVHKFFARF